jgi:hypothetical protein
MMTTAGKALRTVAYAAVGGAMVAIVLATPVALLSPAYSVFAAEEHRSVLLAGLFFRWALRGAGLGLATGAIVMLAVLLLPGRSSRVDELSPFATVNRRRRAVRRSCLVFWVSFPLLACSTSLWMYQQTFRAYETDGMECVGWPVPFYGFGGIAGHTFFDDEALVIDTGAWIAMSTSAALIARFGIYRLSLKAFQRLRGRFNQ